MNPDRWRLRTRLPLAIFSGGLLLAAFPPIDIRFFAWVALVPLLLALRGASGRSGALLGFAAGLGFFSGVLYWLATFGVVAYVPLAIAQAVTWALFGWFAAWGSHRMPGRLFGVPLLFVAAEIVRAHAPLGGFAWGLTGTTQHSGLPLLPVARIGGVFLVGLAVVFINAGIAEVLASGRVWKRGVAAVLTAAAATLPVLLPMGLAGPVEGSVSIAAVQVNVRQFGLQRGPRTGVEDEQIVEKFVEATKDLASNPPNIVIWPENAIDRDPFTDQDLGATINAVVREVGSTFLVGAILNVDERRFRNSLLQYDSSGVVVRRYDKQHLVPFGEYVPWPSLRKYVPALEQVPFDGVPGTEPVIFDAAGARVGGVICFESTFPDLVRRFVREGAQFLVVATNNASFGNSTAAEEHLAQSQLRAVETGRVVVHAAISGISAIVQPDGTVQQRTDLFKPDVIRADVPLTSARTPYTRFGDAIEEGMGGGAVLFMLTGLAGVFDRRRQRREEKAMQEFDWGAEPESQGEVVVAEPESSPEVTSPEAAE